MSIDFTKRTGLPELMDDPNISFEALQGTLKDISKCNSWLGGNAITIKAVEKLIQSYPDKQKWTIVDVGCGDGEMLRLLADYFAKNNLTIDYVGIDISEQGLNMADAASKNYPQVRFLQQDILTLTKDKLPCDVILCTLTLHHLADDVIHKFLKKFVDLANVGVIINDLQRSRLSHRLFQLFSSIFIQSPVAKYDGLISIRSAFSRDELINFSKPLKAKDFIIKWKWAFRYLWVIKTV